MIVVGPDTAIDRFQQVASELLAQIVMQFPDLKLAPGQGTITLPKTTTKAAKAAMVPMPVLLVPLTWWIGVASGLCHCRVTDGILPEASDAG